MFSLIGLCSMLFFLYLRPQEAIPALRSLPFLNLCAALAGLGVVIDLRLRRTQLQPAPTLRFILLLAAWGIFCTAVKAGPGAASAAASRIMIPWIVMILIAHGVSTFRGLQVLLGTILFLGLSIAFIGAHQAYQPFTCYEVKEISGDRAGGKSDGRPCETARECMVGDIEPGSEYLCEKPGLMQTSSVGHGRVRFRGILQDPNEMSMTIAVVLPFAFGFAQLRRRLRHRLLAVLAVGLVGLCTVHTQSRGGQLVFLTVLGAYFIRTFGFLAGGIAGAIGGIPVLLLGGRSGEEAEGSALERAEALYAGIEMVRSSPLFGVGITQFVDHHFITAHNSYLLAVAEMGLPGQFLWLSTLYLSIKTFLTALRRYQDVPEAQVAAAWAMALLASFIGLMVGIFFLSFSYHVVLFIYLGLAGAFYQACKRHDPGFEVRYSLTEAAGLAAFCVVLTTMIAVLSILKMNAG